MLFNKSKMDIHSLLQQRAGIVLSQIESFISTGISEADIAARCSDLLQDNHLEETWYYDAPVLAYVAERTTLSISGREYQPTNTIVKNDDIVTIALSPKIKDCWGAMARTFIVKDGRVVSSNEANSFFQELCQFQQKIHRTFLMTARPDMRMDEVYHHYNRLIQTSGYINLDYRGNFGHSLENHLSKRKFIEKDNSTFLGDCDFFAFETHIGSSNVNYGVKHENVYYFDGPCLTILPINSPI